MKEAGGREFRSTNGRRADLLFESLVADLGELHHPWVKRNRCCSTHLGNGVEESHWRRAVKGGETSPGDHLIPPRVQMHSWTETRIYMVDKLRVLALLEVLRHTIGGGGLDIIKTVWHGLGAGKGTQRDVQMSAHSGGGRRSENVNALLCLSWSDMP